MTNDTTDDADLRARILADVRAGLARAGRTDIEVRDEWLGEWELKAGYSVPLLTVPIGRGSALPIWACFRGISSMDDLVRQFVKDLVQILPQVAQARWMLRRYAGEMRRAAESAVADANKAAIEIELETVTFRPIRSSHLVHEDWRVTADHVLPEIRFLVLDRHLRRTAGTILIEEADDVQGMVEELCDEQLERQIKRLVLRRHRAQVRVDEITLRLLRHYRIEPVKALHHVVEHGFETFEVRVAGGGNGHLSLLNDEGTVRSTVLENPAFAWVRDELRVRGGGAGPMPIPSVGRSVAQICKDDLFADLFITDVREDGKDTILKIDQPFFFMNLLEGSVCQDLRAA